MPWWLWVYLIVAGVKLTVIAAMAVGGKLAGDEDGLTFGILAWPVIWVMQALNLVLKFFS